MHPTPPSNRAVFLDRDGVINQMVYHPDFGTVDSPANPDEFVLLPGVTEAIAELNRMGLLVIVVSNQPGIAKGKFTKTLLDRVTQKMHASVQAGGGRVDAVYFCLHHPDAVVPELKIKCDCRKPRPGLLLQAAKDLHIDLNRSCMVGDGVTDVLAGQRAGVTTLFLSSRKCYICDSLAEHNTRPDYIIANMTEALTVIQAVESNDSPTLDEYRFKCQI